MSGVRFLISGRIALGLLLALPPAGSWAGGIDDRVSDLIRSPASAWATLADGRLQVLVELEDPPAAVAWSAALADRRASHALALENARATTRAHLARIQTAQARVGAALSSGGFHATELFRVARAYNGIAVAVDPQSLGRLRKIPGVRAVHPLIREVPTNSTSVPFIGAPQLWGNTLGLPQDITGAGVTIGIIDTGIDYQHPMFGGSGLLADYQANDRVTIRPGLFPTAKVVGGWDFVGDDYDGTNFPQDDRNPTDCNGHGTHVAGTAAGFGVTSAGATYTGPYGPSTPFGSLAIGPGVAPGAKLYSLRVFGCAGSTAYAVLAIDLALDPDQDGDLADHLDVINLSLGSPYGNLADTTAQAAEYAALAGVVVVAAAGNSGDTYFITESPAVSGRSISVAAIVDPGVPGALLQVNAPAAIAGAYSASSNGFGNGAPNPSGQSGDLVLVQSTSGVPSQGCDTYGNAAAITGKVALIDRGTCTFQLKVALAQAAGAVAAVIANNAPGDLVLMGADPTQPAISIPAIMISFEAGAAIKGQLPGVNATLAAASAADTIASFSSRGPRLATSPLGLKPDVSAPGLQIFSAQTGVTCQPGFGCITPSFDGLIPGGRGLTLSGTSMATPHVAGTMALLKQLHPDWSVEELKASLMNGALHDVTNGVNGGGLRYGLGRIGAGREDVAASAVSQVTAFNDDDAGLVSLSFDREVVGSLSHVKHVRLVNRGTTDQVYSLGFDLRNAEPGVSFSLPTGSSVTAPAGQSVVFEVEMDANARLMDHVREGTVAPTQAAPPSYGGLGNLPRHFLTEESGYLTFSQQGNVVIRLPLYSAVRAASAMAGASPIATGGNASGSTTIALSGTGVCTGTLAGATCTGSFPTTEVSLVTPFELQWSEPFSPTTTPDYLNIRYLGIAYDPVKDLVLFGISTWGSWYSPNQAAFTVVINQHPDGTHGRTLVSSSPGLLTSDYIAPASLQDTYFDFLYDRFVGFPPAIASPANTAGPDVIDSRLLDNNVQILSASPAALGIGPGETFTWTVQACPPWDVLCRAGYFSNLGPFPWNTSRQGLNFGGARLFQDLPGASIPVTFNTANLAANGSLGALLLHHHNAEGRRDQAIPVAGLAAANPGIAMSVSPSNPLLGQNVTFTLTVSNDASVQATVDDDLPGGLDFVSADSGGRYEVNDGVRRVYWVLPGGSATSLHMVATVTTTDRVCNAAQIEVFPTMNQLWSNRASLCLQARTTLAPGVTSISPNHGSTAGGTPVTISGSNFQNGASVTIGGVAATNVNVADAGTITATTGSHAAGTVDVVVTSGGMLVPLPSSFFFAPPPSAATSFYTLTPCRLLDTRNPAGPYGGPALGSGERRIFQVTGQCGIPSSAIAVSASLTAIGSTAAGFLSLFPGNALPLGVTDVAFGPGRIRASNTILELATDGSGTAGVLNAAAGSAHFLLDVNGYFQ